MAIYVPWMSLYMPDKAKTAMYFEPWNEIRCPCGWWINRASPTANAAIRKHQDDCPQARVAPKGGGE